MKSKLFLLTLQICLPAVGAFSQGYFNSVYISPNPVPMYGSGRFDTTVFADGGWESWWYLMVEPQTRAADLDTSWYNTGDTPGDWAATGDSSPKALPQASVSRAGGMWYEARALLHASPESGIPEWYPNVDTYTASGWWEWIGDGFVMPTSMATKSAIDHNSQSNWGLGHELETFYINAHNTSSRDYIYKPYVFLSIYNQDDDIWSHYHVFRLPSYPPSHNKYLQFSSMSPVRPGWNWVTLTQGDVTYDPIPGEWIYFYPPTITSVVATSTSTHAGNRSSDTVLKLVHDGSNNRQADISATISNFGIQSGYPYWSGNGVAFSSGSAVTTYNGMSSTAATCTIANGISKSVDIELIHNGRINRSVDFSVIEQLNNAINNVVQQKFGQRSWELSADLTGTKEYVDMYNDGSNIGIKHELEGDVSVALDKITIVDAQVPMPGMPLVKATFSAWVSAGNWNVNSTLVRDQSKADPLTVSGEIGVSASVGASVGATVGFCELVDAGIAGSAVAEAAVYVSISETNERIYAKAGLEAGNVDFEVMAYFKADLPGDAWSCEVSYQIWQHTIELGFKAETPELQIYHFD